MDYKARAATSMARVDPARARGVMDINSDAALAGLPVVGDGPVPDVVVGFVGVPEVVEAGGGGGGEVPATPRITNDSVRYGPTPI